VFLTEEVGPAMKTMRAAAAEMRRDALAGLSDDDQQYFVDTLLLIKANLSTSNGENGSMRNGSVRNGSVRDGSATEGNRSKVKQV